MYAHSDPLVAVGTTSATTVAIPTAYSSIYIDWIAVSGKTAGAGDVTIKVAGTAPSAQDLWVANDTVAAAAFVTRQEAFTGTGLRCVKDDGTRYTAVAVSIAGAASGQTVTFGYHFGRP